MPAARRPQSAPALSCSRTGACPCQSPHGAGGPAAVKIACGHADFQNHVGGHGAAVGLASPPVGSEYFLLMACSLQRVLNR